MSSKIIFRSEIRGQEKIQQVSENFLLNNTEAFHNRLRGRCSLHSEPCDLRPANSAMLCINRYTAFPTHPYQDNADKFFLLYAALLANEKKLIEDAHNSNIFFY